MSTENLTEESVSQPNKLQSMFGALVIVLSIALGWCIYLFVMGDGSHFVDGDNANHPLPGDYFGIVYKGGFIVPFLMAMFIMTMTTFVERLITLSIANGKGSVSGFVRNIKEKLRNDDVEGAIEDCDVQKGSIGNVVKSVLLKYKQVQADSNMSKEQKIAAINKEQEEAAALELPMLEKNLPILATLGSVATLIALLGTVMGMIKAFAAMSEAGAPDATALATGISEALINTALGIGTSAFAIMFYNYFTNKIDTMTYSMDEAGMSIAATFAAKN